MWCTPEEHKKLERQAASRGDVEGLIQKAMMVMDGCETSQQRKTAQKWLALLERRANRMGMSFAAVHLGSVASAYQARLAGQS